MFLPHQSFRWPTFISWTFPAFILEFYLQYQYCKLIFLVSFFALRPPVAARLPHIWCWALIYLQTEFWPEIIDCLPAKCIELNIKWAGLYNLQFLCGMANIPHTTHKFKMKGKKSARVLAIPGEKLVSNLGTTSHRSLLLSKSFVLHNLGEKGLYIKISARPFQRAE